MTLPPEVKASMDACDLKNTHTSNATHRRRMEAHGAALALKHKLNMTGGMVFRLWNRQNAGIGWLKERGK